MTIRFGSALAVACTALVLTGCERSAVAESSDEQNKPTTTQEAGTMASDVSKASYLLGYNQVERMSSASCPGRDRCSGRQQKRNGWHG